jgi:ArsR family transcriptional regulator, arsenate/arsenite/antimonite-responsive transcriptional repressor
MTIETMNTAASINETRLQDYASKLKVLGHPVRLRLLCAISRQEEPCVSELWVCLNQPQPVVSQHLAVLKERGIVKSEVQGNKRIYSIIDSFVQDLVQTLDCSPDLSD